MAFIEDIIQFKKDLDKLGHNASIPHGTEPHQEDGRFVDNLKSNLDFCITNNIMRRNFDMVVDNDAILVINKKRNGVRGYIGVSVLMEMAIAHHFNKKIFVLHKVPDYRKIRWAHEVEIMQPIILNGDITKIK